MATPSPPPAPPPAPSDPVLPPVDRITCRFCGGYPAVSASVRGHRGLIVMMQFQAVDGPFCRTCGTAVVRDLSAQTLVEGWWGLLSVFLAPLTLLGNLMQYRAIRALPEPVRCEGAVPVPVGKPLLRRPQAWGFLVPVVAAVLLVSSIVRGAAGAGGSSESAGAALPPASGNAAGVGECLVDVGGGDAPYLLRTHCLSGTLQVVARLHGSDQTNCPSSTTSAYTVSDRGQDVVLCLIDYGG